MSNSSKSNVQSAGLGELSYDSSHPPGMEWSHLVDNIVRHDAELKEWARLYASHPDEYEIEARLIRIEEGRIISSVPEEVFRKELFPRHSRPWTIAEKKWPSFHDYYYAHDERKRVPLDSDYKEQPQKAQWMIKTLVGHKDFRVKNRPFGIRLSIKQEVPMDCPSPSSSSGPWPTKAEAAAESPIEGVEDFKRVAANPTSTTKPRLSTTPARMDSPGSGRTDRVPTRVRVISRASALREYSEPEQPEETSLERGEGGDPDGRALPSAIAKRTVGFQMDFSIVGTGNTLEEAERAVDSSYEVEIELSAKASLQKVHRSGQSRFEAQEFVHWCIGTLLLRALQLQEITSNIALIPLIT